MITKYEIRDASYEKGFTLVELLLALMVTSIILTTVATLTYALGSANATNGDSARQQAQVRFATLRISELIRQSKLIYSASADQVVFWRDDSNDEQVDADELITIETKLVGSDTQLCELNGASESIVLVPQCGNVQFQFDRPDLPVTKRKFVSIWFELFEDGVAERYQISASLRSWAGHLLDADGNII